MADLPSVSFADLLKRLRLKAGLTQEELASAATLSERTVSDLERGVHKAARKQTVGLLADALGLEGAARAGFEDAARGRYTDGQIVEQAVSTGASVAATRTLPRDIRSFTGREAELTRLLRAVADARESSGMVSIHAVGGMAGIGKTAFAVRAAHRLAAWYPDGQIFLAMHGHTPGQQPVNSADALASLLQTVGVPASLIPPGPADRESLWRNRLAGKKMLLLLDDAVGHEQIRPLLPGNPGCLVIVTSRHRLVALEDAQVISLDTLPPEDAGMLFVQLAVRPELEVDDPSVSEVVRLCGYLPLAIGMLARQLYHHPAWTIRALAVDVAQARDRLPMMQAENLSVRAAFEMSYQALTSPQQQAFRRLGLHPGTDIDAYAMAALSQASTVTARSHLEAFYDRHLLTEAAQGRYRCHDLIRAYARSLVGPRERNAATGRLLDYYLHAVRIADSRFAQRTPAVSPVVTVHVPAHLPDLHDQEQALSWMAAERVNLQAAASYAAVIGRLDHAIAIPAAMHGFLTSQGHYRQACALHEVALKAALAAGDPLAEAGARTDLGDSQHLIGDFPAAIANLDLARGLSHGHGDDLSEAGALTLLGDVQQGIADYLPASDNLKRALALYRQKGNLLGESRVLDLLGDLQQAMGDYQAALTSLAQALALHRKLGHRLREAVALSYLGKVHYLMGNYSAASTALDRALELHQEEGHRLGQANALCEIGILKCITGPYPAAVQVLTQALDLHCELKHPLGEATALDHLGEVLYLTGNVLQASTCLSRALELHRQLRNRLGQAEVLNTMGEFAVASSTPEHAVACHEEALMIAGAIRSPLQLARAQEGLGRALLQMGKQDLGCRQLHIARGLYQAIGSANVIRVATSLHDLNSH